MRVEPVHDPGAEWDDFVATTRGATLGHASAWARIFRDAYATLDGGRLDTIDLDITLGSFDFLAGTLSAENVDGDLDQEGAERDE